MSGNQPLPNMHKSRASGAFLRIGIIILSIIFALIIGAIILLLQNQNPIEVYYYLFISPMSNVKGLIKIGSKITPLLLAGLACAFAFKGNIWNIGVEGQLYASALVAAILGNTIVGLPRLLHLLICVVGAMLTGALLAWIPAILKVRLNVHEVLSTIMGNHIISAIVSLIVVDFFRYSGPIARTPNVQDTARLYQFMRPQQFNTAIVWALIIVFGMYYFFKRTPLGWRIDAAGKNLEAAKYSGIDSRKLVITSMVISGSIAGLVGVERVLGGFGYMEVNFSPGYGWDAIAIAIIANNNPIGVLFVSILMGVLSFGGSSINSMTDVPSEWVNILSALIFIFVVAGNALVQKYPRILTMGRKR